MANQHKKRSCVRTSSSWPGTSLPDNIIPKFCTQWSWVVRSYSADLSVSNGGGFISGRFVWLLSLAWRNLCKGHLLLQGVPAVSRVCTWSSTLWKCNFHSVYMSGFWMVRLYAYQTLKSPVFRWNWYLGVRYLDGYFISIIILCIEFMQAANV